MCVVVWLLGLATGLFFWFAAESQVPGGSLMFFSWASDLTAIQPPDVAQRDMGFPLLIWLSGGSVRGIFVVQALMAVVMPPLIFETLRPFSRWGGAFAALLAIGMAAPWLFARETYPDQAGIFFTLLSLWALAMWLTRGDVRWLVVLTGAGLMLSVTRPALNAAFPCLMVVAILFGQRRWWPLVGCAAAFLLGLIAYHGYRANVFDVAKLGYTPSYTGEQVFYNAYVNSGDLPQGLTDDIGPNMAVVMEMVHAKLRQPELIAASVEQVSREFAATYFLQPPEKLEALVWRWPNYEYGLLIDGMVDDATLLRAAGEIALAHPWYTARYILRNLGHFLFWPGYAHTRNNDLSFTVLGLQFYPEVKDWAQIAVFSPENQEFVTESRRFGDFRWIWGRVWLHAYWPFVWGTSFLAIAGWIAVISAPFLHSRAFVGAFMAVTGLIFYNALIVGAFAEPDFRYENMILILRALAAGFGLVACWPHPRCGVMGTQSTRG